MWKVYLFITAMSWLFGCYFFLKKLYFDIVLILDLKFHFFELFFYLVQLLFQNIFFKSMLEQYLIELSVLLEVKSLLDMLLVLIDLFL